MKTSFYLYIKYGSFIVIIQEDMDSEILLCLQNLQCTIWAKPDCSISIA